MTWQDEFNELSSAQQYKIREMATIFGVPVSAAYSRSKECGLLQPKPERNENSSFVSVPNTGTVVPKSLGYNMPVFSDLRVHPVMAGFVNVWKAARETL